MSPSEPPCLGYYWGDDAYSVEHAPRTVAARLAETDGVPRERWRVDGSATTPEQIAERVATSPLFGGGIVVVVTEPGPLVATKPLAARLGATLNAVAPGNALVFLETVDGSGRRPASLEALRKSVEEAGGEVRQFKSPTRDEMSQWIAARAAERGISIAPAAATLLAERVGAFVREGDVDRRRQGALAVAELEKLAVYRLDSQIRADDVKALVADAVPGSTWAFLDAIGSRRAGEAAALGERLAELPGPVLVVHLHRRLRELIQVADMFEGGADPAAVISTLKLNPYVARKLAEQTRHWTLPELERALEGLLELDAELKRGGESRRGASLTLWIAERVRSSGAR